MQGGVCDANAMEISLSGAFILMSMSSGPVSACLCRMSRDLEDGECLESYTNKIDTLTEFDAGAKAFNKMWHRLPVAQGVKLEDRLAIN